MKILFIMKYPLEDSYNLKAKFDGQMQAARRLGHNVSFIGWDAKGMYLIHDDKRTMLKKIKGTQSVAYIHGRAFLDLFRSAALAVKLNSFDCAYIRIMPFEFFGYLLLRTLKSCHVKIIEEIPTFPLRREKPASWKRKLADIYLRLWEPLCAQYLDMYAVIGESAGDSFRGRLAIGISNGIDVCNLKVRTPGIRSEVVHILALASMSCWHGYDRLIKGAAQYRGNVPLMIHMVGNEGDGSLETWKNLVHTLRLDDVVRFEGQLSGDVLKEMFDLCDIGIGSLGMYRTGFASGSILKIREYTARGLPFVYAADDPAIMRSCDFCIQIPNDESPVDMQRVVDFALRTRENPALPNLMRAYAQVNMSWEAQLKKVFGALER